ncbi:MAG TPA: HD domain-containing phosphohydrolase [Acidimicrobiales bacterium]|nr:HD domain-containing phosphohydrolase [Acidimicrobiales bacterium]
MEGSGVRLTDLLVALSLATDLGFGQPAEHMMRSARISMRLGERLGLGADDLAVLYDVSMLTYVACPVYGNEGAAMFGDDIPFRAGVAEVDLAGFPAMMYMLRRAGYGTSPFNRMRQGMKVMATQGRGVIELMAAHCSAAGELADRIGLRSEVREGIQQSYARWDGQGVPDVSGEALSLAARISHVAEACEVIHRNFGTDRAVEMTRARSGTHFDPAVAAAVGPEADLLFEGLDADTVDAVLDAEPVARPPLTVEELDRALEAVGDFCDLRCPFFTGHSRGTADLAAAAAAGMGLAAADTQLVRRAALVHDVGRFGVPGSVWDKPGPLSQSEQERMRLHVYYAERIFSRPEPLQRIGLLAAAHHERMDASGYHRGVGGTMLSVPARILAAADAYHAMMQPRPHRAALDADAARAELRREGDHGRLDPGAVDAVLGAAGHRPSRARGSGPAGLTARESDVLGLLAQGLPNKGIARRLGITPKTAGNHVERIYSKLGVSNRAAAAMRAMQLGVVGAPPGPEELAAVE